jgi:hypothetical protein
MPWGLPQPQPFVPANPNIYEYTDSFSPERGFFASLVRTISFASVLVGFPEDFTPFRLRSCPMTVILDKTTTLALSGSPTKTMSSPPALPPSHY